MGDPSATELKAAFAARVESLEPEREARLQSFDYPAYRRRHRRIWAAAAGTAGTAVSGAIAAAVVMLSSGASVAEGWTPTPTAPSQAALAAATAACNSVNDGSGAPVLTGTPVLTDGRGSYTAAIYVTGQVAHICISNGEPPGTSLSMHNLHPAYLGPAYPPPGPNQLGIPAGSTARDRQYLWGPAGSDVSGVSFGFADGTTVRATVQNGWFFVWWPSAEEPTSVQVITSSGASNSPMPFVVCRKQPANCVFEGGSHT